MNNIANNFISELQSYPEVDKL